MKKLHFLPLAQAAAATALLLALAAACSNETPVPTAVGDDAGTPITLTATLATDGDAGSNTPQTRLGYTDETGSTPAPGVIVKWTVGDAFKLYPASGQSDGIEYKIDNPSSISGDGKSATFTATTTPSTPITGVAKAIYPAAAALLSDKTPANYWNSISLSMDGQIQTGDNNYDHIAAYDYMTATVADIDALPTNNDLAFHHLTAMMTVKITGRPTGYTPSTAPDNSPALLILSVDDAGAGFYNKMYISGSTYVPGSTSLALNGITWTESGFTAHLMIFPTDLTGKTFTLIVRCNDGTAYRYTTPQIGKAYVAGMRYTATISDNDNSKWTKVESSTTAQTLDNSTQAATAFASGDGGQTSPYIISTAAQLKYLQTQVNGGNNYNNSYFRLTTDINIATTEWTPIGTDYSHTFSGNFDGNGHTISGTLKGSSANFGLFGYISNASIRNLHVAATVTNSYNGSAECSTGGLVGYARNTPISGCSYKGTVSGGKTTGNTSNTGGLIGQSQDITLSGCTVEAGSKVQGGSAGTSSSKAGGLVGYAGISSRLESCTNHAEIAGATDSKSYVGGVAGYAVGNIDSPVSIHNCRNHGKVGIGDNASKDCYAGGLIGYVRGYTTLSNSRNTGDVTGGKTSGYSSYTGGLVAALSTNNEIIGCTNEGTVTGGTAATKCYTGGLAGSSSGTLHTSRNTSTAAVAAGSVTGASGTENYTGGLVGSNTTDGTVYSCCANEATVDGSPASSSEGSDNRIGGGKNTTVTDCQEGHTVPNNK
ncbi:GLUG motif-containing protein [Bacteroides sp. GD17]|uniref:GLUG motif-containing protein n=1 Tax=Bacteroides sp. GD17 TaxID=3139826 RepID=UPI0025F09C72|nr:GLUG motif-containing protein [uncultured Bacteroides sp.]